MSIFKEKDDMLTRCFQDIFDQDSDEEDEDEGLVNGKLQNNLRNVGGDDGSPAKKLKVENPELVTECLKQNNTSVEFISIDCDDDSDEEQKDDGKKVKVTQKTNNVSVDDVITLSSSDEDEEESIIISSVPENLDTTTDSKNCSIIVQEVSLSQEDYDFNLKLILAGVYKQYPTTYKTRLEVALKALIEELEGRDRELVIRLSTGETIPLYESPHSLKLTPGVILQALEVNRKGDEKHEGVASNPNEICVKLQDGNRKHTKEYRILKNEPIRQLKELYAKEFNIPTIDRIKLCFDGDLVEDESTPDELEIEDDCILDVF